MNPGTLAQIASPGAGLQSLRQGLVSEIPTTLLLYFTKMLVHMCANSLIAVNVRVNRRAAKIEIYFDLTSIYAGQLFLKDISADPNYVFSTC